MRDLKFRRVFKNRSNGEISFMEWGNIDFRNQSVSDFSSFASPGTNSHSGPIADLQYTGLKDKNGKEIYEGDRLKRRQYLENGKEYIDYFFEVRWGTWCYCLFIADKQIRPLDIIEARACEVVGNVYEKPNSEPEDKRSVARDDDSSNKAD